MAFKKIHQPCPDCGGTDPLAVNEDGSTKCFNCGTYRRDEAAIEPSTHTHVYTEVKKPVVARSDAYVGAFPARRLTIATMRTYEVEQTTDGEVIFPYHNKTGEAIAVKVRSKDKLFKVEGDWKGAVLFGQSRFQQGGKVLTLTEGEFDALAVHQMTTLPAVSVRSGAQSALSDCKAAFEWIDSFDKVVICFDNDEAGKEATKKVAELLGSKACMFRHHNDYKDACEWLAHKSEAQFSNAWYGADAYKPEGIVTITDIKERLLAPPVAGVPWCFDTLTEVTYGRRRGELYAFGAGVGVGKTDVFTQQIAYDIDKLGLRVGVIYLEQNVVETSQRVMGKLDKKLYHVPDLDWTRQEYEESVDRLEDREQLYMMEHFGAMGWRSIKNIIKFFNKAYDIDHIYLDHLTALSANEQDERRALDGIMADMASLAQELGIIIHFISHLTTPEGKAHEEGGRVLEKHFTGSRAIARWSHYMFGLERNKQHSDPIKRQTTTFRVLKDRFTGRATGTKFGLQYNQKNGILSESIDLMEDDNI